MSSQKTKLKCIMEGVQSQYAVIPADISRRLQDIQLSLQRADEKVGRNMILLSSVTHELSCTTTFHML